MARPVTISLVSFPTFPPEAPDRLARTIGRMEAFVDEAARRNSALVAFPETCNYLASGPTWLKAEPIDGPHAFGHAQEGLSARRVCRVPPGP